MTRIGTAVLLLGALGACDRNNLADEQKRNEERITQIQREADEKVASAQREAEQKIAEARSNAAKNIQETQNDLNKDRDRVEFKTKTEYKQYAEAKTKELEQKTAAIKAKLHTIAAPARTEVASQLKSAEVQDSTVRQSIKELDKATNDTWMTSKAKIDASLDAYEQAVTAAHTKL